MEHQSTSDQTLIIQANEQLRTQIYGGNAIEALAAIEKRILENGASTALLALKAEALKMSGNSNLAINAYIIAATHGMPGGWFGAGAELMNMQRFDEALKYLAYALAEEPQRPDVLDSIVVSHFNSGNLFQGISFARQQLQNQKSTVQQRARAAILLSQNQLHDECSRALKSLMTPEVVAENPSLLGSALATIHHTCDWEFVNAVRSAAKDQYSAGHFAQTGEYPLTNIIWCHDEAINLGVTQAYALRMIPLVEPLAPKRKSKHQRLRIGYLSNDFRNHATLHLLIGLLEHHDKKKFEVFAYDYSQPDISDYRTRFLNAVDHHIDISTNTDKDAAHRIASDDLDLLIDLKGHTGLARLGILSYRPAPVQASYLGFPGSIGLSYIDYLITDRYVTPDSSITNYPEKLCRLPHSYQCNDGNQSIPQSSKTRQNYGLPTDAIVFCSFNQSYKIDSDSFSLWLDIILRVPNSVLWLLADGELAKQNLTNYALKKGVDPRRLIFAPPLAPIFHRERLQFADLALDTLLCNGHTTTSDMLLWGGLPVVTVRGNHFASRVTESLLTAMELPELIGDSPKDMVEIAVKIGKDTAYREELRKKISRNRSSSPLFDTPRFTRNFELGIEKMISNHYADTPSKVLDILESPSQTQRAR